MTSRLFVRQVGRSGPIIVLLHGLGASGRLWRMVADRLTGETRLMCPDLLGFGRSPRPSIAYSVADHLAALDAALDGAGLSDEPVMLGGQSLGAALALEWAAARPERFRGVVLIALPVYRSAAEAQECIAALSPLAWATVSRPALGRLLCGVMCAGRPFWRAIMPLLMPGVPADIARDMVLHDWTSYSGTLENVLVEHRIAPAAERLAATDLPVRLLHGQRDSLAPFTTARELADQFRWRLTVAPGRGHRLPLEAPGACAAVLSELRLATERI